MARRWYVLRAQGGREDQVKESLEKRIRAEGLEGSVTRVLVPSERVSEIKGGQRRVRERKVYPNYLMVEVELDDGRLMVIVQEKDDEFAVGDRIRLLQSRDGTMRIRQ